MYLPESSRLAQVGAHPVLFLLEDSKEVLYPSSLESSLTKRSSVLWLTRGLTHALCKTYFVVAAQNQQIPIPIGLAVLSVQPTDLQSFNQVPYTLQHPVNDLKGKATLFVKRPFSQGAPNPLGR